jgi:hypothetical protein
MLKTLNKIFAILILLLNVYFIPVTLITIIKGSGPLGYGFSSIVISLLINLLIITAFLAFKIKFEKKIPLLIFNLITFSFALFVFILVISKPQISCGA